MKLNYKISEPQYPALDPDIDFILNSGTLSYPAVQDGPMVVKRYRDFKLNGGTVTTSVRCQGLMIIVEGNCYINGTITMTARGANAAVSNKSLNLKTMTLESNIDNLYQWINGGAGSCGAGGAGSAWHSMGEAYAGSGAAGSIVSGGAGGGGAACERAYGVARGGSGGANGGAGGYGAVLCSGTSGNKEGAGGGAGNAGGSGATCGSGAYGYTGTSGTGGLIILIIRGNLTIGQNGQLLSLGSAGGAGYNVAGGGSGGGSITILYGKKYSNSGTINVNGGSGGGGARVGGAGKVGSIRVLEEPTLQYNMVFDYFDTPTLEPEINRWIQDNSLGSNLGHFEQPITNNQIVADCSIQINGKVFRVLDIVGDGTTRSSIMLSGNPQTGKIEKIIPVFMTFGNTISGCLNIPNDSKYILQTNSNSRIKLDSINNINSMILNSSNGTYIAFSLDNKKHWTTFYNNEWIVITLDQLLLYGMTSDVINNMSQKDLNHILYCGVEFDVAILFHYIDGKLPIFNSIEFNGYFNENLYDVNFGKCVNDLTIDKVGTYT